MSSKAAILRAVRQIHFYFGVFIAPSLIFFAISGALQTFNLHESGKGSDYQPPRWVVTLSQIHKDQRASAPPRKPDRPAQSTPSSTRGPSAVADRPGSPSGATPASSAKKHNPLPLKIFFLLVSLGLITSAFTGIYMAYSYGRGAMLVSLLLLAGLVIPVMLLWAV